MSIREDLKAYVDGELSPSSAESMRLEIARNPALAREVEEIRSIGSTLRASRASAPHGLESTLAVLEAPSRPKRLSTLAWVGLAAAAACGALALAQLGVAPERMSARSLQGTVAMETADTPAPLNPASSRETPAAGASPAQTAPVADKVRRVATRGESAGRISSTLRRGATDTQFASADAEGSVHRKADPQSNASRNVFRGGQGTAEGGGAVNGTMLLGPQLPQAPAVSRRITSNFEAVETIEVRVASIAAAKGQIAALAKAAGGSVESKPGDASMEITIQVPAEVSDKVLLDVQGLERPTQNGAPANSKQLGGRPSSKSAGQNSPAGSLAGLKAPGRQPDASAPQAKPAQGGGRGMKPQAIAPPVSALRRIRILLKRAASSS